MSSMKGIAMGSEGLFESPTGKRCSTCKQLKPLEDFNRRSTARDGRQWTCRACNAAYHQTHKERHMSQIRRRNARILNGNRRRLLAYLDTHPCVDCGEADPVVLEFDHLRDKRADVTRLLKYGHSWETLLAEIAKCEVRCANCHRRRSQVRSKSYRVFGVPGEPRSETGDDELALG